ncbi:Holliday junction resolvase RusA-like endonuclease [Saccharopolyspora lacisalsi]|uniref:Holliday junction resolvase RusA-like endonuclease n=1 Tax=Halosaccharopolyspora lacisalsi TaxID=1000566 RepID=A0A839E9D2_9PSEU|nr:RusA family crossover junction endodeoxyribonuclease [Halosaccharopolyspora lacisalsi]MBA8827871.1 Holliday junction resolvase RusA-like endonuclease [Halosaccharopolyspora lacisalsi]
MTVADYLATAPAPMELIAPHLVSADYAAPFVAHLVIEGEPQPKERARKGKKGWYTPTATKVEEDRIAWAFKQANRDHVPGNDDRYGIAVHWASTKRGHVKDTDNLLKILKDALNKLAWVDDAHVREEITRKIIVNEQPYTEAIIYRLPNTDPDPVRKSRARKTAS